MKKKLSYIFNNNIVTFLSVIIIAIFLFIYMIIVGIEPFGNNSFVSNDCLQLVYPFLITFRTKLLSGDSLLYYWNNALGDDFLPTYWYSISSPLYFLVVFVDKYDVRSFLNITIALRIILSAGTFGFFISKRNKESSYNFFNICLSCAYALSSFIIGYYNQCMWLDSYALFPIIMLGYDKLKNEKKPYLYIISLVLTAFCNFFMVFMIGIFLVLWFMLDNHESFDKFFKDLLYFIVCSVLAVVLSAISIIISFYALLNTRVSVTEKLTHEWFGSVFLLIRKLFFLSSPVVMNYNNSANLYVGTISIILLLVYFLSDRISISEKIRKGILILILFLSMNESVMNYIWHGFHYQVGAPNRFSFIFIFLLLLLSSDSMYKIAKPSRCCIGLVLTELCLFVTFFFVDLDSIIDDKYAFFILIILIMIYAVFIILYSYKMKKAFLYIICLLMLSETIIYASLSLKYASTDITDYDNVMKSYDVYKNDSFDSSFKRSVLINGVNENDGALYNLYGISGFNGFMNSNTQAFIDSVGYQNEANVIDEKGGGFPILYDILGVKDICCTDDISVNCFDISNEYKDDNLSIYHNPDAFSLGFGIKEDYIKTKFVPDEYNKIKNINNYIYNMTGYNDIINEINPQYSITGNGYQVVSGEAENLLLYCYPMDSVNDKYISASFVTDKSGYYNTCVLFEDFAYITIFVNDKAVRKEGSKISIQINSDNTLRKTTGDIIVLDLHMGITDKNAYDRFINALKSNQMETKFIKSNHFTANVDLSNGQVLFTSIPFDEGWHIYENDKELEKQKFADTFILLDIGEGHHELEFKYIPKGFYLSIIVTFTSLVFFILLIIYCKKHNNSLP